MDLHVKISVETAGMLQELKKYYQKKRGVFCSKSDVLTNVVFNAFEKVSEIDWEKIYKKKFNINNYGISDGVLRPKFQVNVDVMDKLNDLKERMPKQLGVRSVTMGVCVKLLFKYSLLEIERENNGEIDSRDIIEQIIEEKKLKYFSKAYSEETQIAVDNFAEEILKEYKAKNRIRVE